jgi:alpha-1,6-mannosyltransferase
MRCWEPFSQFDPVKFCDLTQFYSPVSGGVRRYLEQKVAYLRRRRPQDQHVLIVPGEKDECLTQGQATVYTVRSPLVSRTSRYRVLLRLGAIERILEDERPAIIESGDPYQVAWKTIISGRALSIPTVAFYHSHFPEAYLRSVAKFFGKIGQQIAEDMAEKYIRALYNRFEKTFVPSPALGQLLESWGVENIHLTDLGVDPEIFHPSESDRAQTRQALGVAPDTCLLLYAGRLAAEKNVRTLFSAFEILHHTEPARFQLLVLGDGTQRPLLKQTQEATGRLLWQPYCSDPHQLAAYYRAADLFVHPGIQETFGLVTLESQACGTPVVGIRGSYMDRIIFTDQTHWAPENSPAALAEAIRHLAAREPGQTGKNASALVRSRYSWDAVFDRLFQAYEDTCQHYVP